MVQKAPQAVICLDAFHVVSWATKALDEVRRRLTAELRSAGATGTAGELKGTRWALLKNPKDLTMLQRTSLAGLAKLNSGVYRCYLLKEQMRAIFAAKGDHGRILLAGWLVWAKHSQLPPFVKPARTIEHYKPLIVNTLVHELSNARSEASNTHLHTLTQRAYGFHTPEALIAMAMLTRGGCRPPLPGRN